jgi:hypothetical protein
MRRRRYTGFQPMSPKAKRTKAIVSTDAWRRQYPERVTAISVVAKAINTTYALDRGPCEKCGTNVRVCGFHVSGYANPLDVVWRCRRCHGAIRREARLAQATVKAIPIWT